MNKNERGWNESFPGENIRQIQRKKDIRGNRCRTVYWKLQHGGLWVNWPTFYRWKKKKKKNRTVSLSASPWNIRAGMLQKILETSSPDFLTSVSHSSAKYSSTSATRN